MLASNGAYTSTTQSTNPRSYRDRKETVPSEQTLVRRNFWNLCQIWQPHLEARLDRVPRRAARGTRQKLLMGPTCPGVTGLFVRLEIRHLRDHRPPATDQCNININV